MTLQRKTLLESLKMVMPGIESGNVVLQGSDSFIFHEGKLFTYNDSIAVVVPLEQTGLVDEEIEGAVHAKEFYNTISKFTNDEISFTITDKNRFLITCGKAKVELTLMQDFDFKKRLEGVTPNSDEWIDLPDEFTTALASCRMSTNKTPMAGVYVRDDKVISTDGYQINISTTKAKLPIFWISDSSLGELLKMKNIKKIQIGRNWVHFMTSEEVILSVKTLNSTTFPYEKVMSLMEKVEPKDDDFHAKFPKELFLAVDRADNFAFELSNQSVIRLTLAKDKITVSSERASGRYTEDIAWEDPIDSDLEPITMCISASMMEAMAQHSLEFYIVNVAGKKSVLTRLLFVSDTSKHLMCTFKDTGK